jgi:hypothetical protein
LLPGKFDDARALGLNQRVIHRDDGLGVRLLCGLEACIELTGISHRN